jgi:hypothetical protein
LQILKHSVNSNDDYDGGGGYDDICWHLTALPFEQVMLFFIFSSNSLSLNQVINPWPLNSGYLGGYSD